jgi:hypothetical protein
VWLTVLAFAALQLLAVCLPGGQGPGPEYLGISNDEKISLDSRRRRGGERTAFRALSLACSLDSAGLSTRRITRGSI